MLVRGRGVLWISPLRHPQYHPGNLYVEGDVYSFGVFLLEMLSGMRALDCDRPSGQHSLVDWAKANLSERRKVLSRALDQRLEGQCPPKGAVQAAQLILKCLWSEPRMRPSMSEVVETLEQIQAIKHKPQEPKNNPRRPTDRNHAHNRSPLHPQAGNVGNGKKCPSVISTIKVTNKDVSGESNLQN